VLALTLFILEFKVKKLNRRQLRHLIIKETSELNEAVTAGAIVVGLGALASFGFTALNIYLNSFNKKGVGSNVTRPYDVGGAVDLYEMFGMDDYQKETGESSVGLTGITGSDNFSSLEVRVEQELGSIPKRVGELIQSGMSDHEAISLALKEDEIEAQKFLQAAARIQTSPVTGLG
jgi:hypothetical protein